MSLRTEFIRRWEGYSPTVYLDSAKKPTIGVGHLLSKDEAIRYANTTLSKEQVDALLQLDLRRVDNAISRLVQVSLNENEYAALSSFIFNVGVGAFRRSTLRMRLNRGEREPAAEQFLCWVRSGGNIIPGLISRRKAEMELFLS